MLKAGYLLELAYYDTTEGTPQGGIISPLPANIYLNELDQYIAAQYDNLPRHRKLKRRKNVPPIPRTIIRFADDFVILVRGTREDAEKIKDDLAQFIAERMQMNLSKEKTLITHIDEGFDGRKYRSWREHFLEFTHPYTQDIDLKHRQYTSRGIGIRLANKQNDSQPYRCYNITKLSFIPIQYARISRQENLYQLPASNTTLA